LQITEKNIMGEYDGIKPQDDFGHSMDDENDLSGYHPGMGAMVAMGSEDMGYESGSSDFEAFDMGHTWSPDMLPGMPHGPFDEPDKMGWERELYQRRGPESRLFGRGVGWKDEFGDDGDPAAVDPTALAADLAADPIVVEPGYYGGFPHRPGWGAWQHPGVGRLAGRRR
jgi:hypothetical protein